MQPDASDVVGAYPTNGWEIGLEQVLADVAAAIDTLSQQECANYFANAGYVRPDREML